MSELIEPLNSSSKQSTKNYSYTRIPLTNKIGNYKN